MRLTQAAWILLVVSACATSSASSSQPEIVQTQAHRTDTGSAAAAPVAEGWKAIARQDVLAAYDVFVANHPGMHDPTNPEFADQLKRARDAGLARVETIADRQGYVEALSAFSSVLSDGHARVIAKPPRGAEKPTRQWPGFVAAWRGENMVVHFASTSSPAPIGSTITSCDGMPIRETVERRLLTTGFRPEEEGQWWSLAPVIFTSGSTAKGRPESCVFRTPDGEVRETKLQWTAAPEKSDPDGSVADLLMLASDGERTDIGLSEPRPGIFLVGLPDFQPDSEGVKAYRAMFEILKARRAELAKARALVLDLRHNQGGSSAWARDAAGAVWGDDVVDAAMAQYFEDVSIWWRASEGNAAYVAQLEELVRKDGRHELAQSIQEVGEGMRRALANGEPFYVDRDEDEPEPTRAASTRSSKLKTPVYVIVPGGCFSACLDALDIFTRFDNVKLIGAPSSADSTYMEVRVEELPSGHGVVVLPNKIWMGRPRRSGEVYRPAIEVTATDWSTNTFLEVIEQDLAASRD